MSAIVEMRNITRHFGHVIALAGVSFDIRPGECHCLLGDNGAGKSTFIKIMSGVYKPSGGEVLVEGAPTLFNSPRDAMNAGIATVFATCQVMEFGSAAADRGLLKEFEAIISVVIGGALLTGGYGSVIGAALGALIFGVVQQGLFFAGVESSLFRVFLGAILLMAVILNTYIRRIITGER